MLWTVFSQSWKCSENLGPHCREGYTCTYYTIWMLRLRVPNDLSSESGCTEWSIRKLLDLVVIWKHSGKLLDLVTNWKRSQSVGSAPVRRDKMEDWGIGGSTLQVTTGDLAVLSRLPSLAHSSYIQITEAWLIHHLWWFSVNCWKWVACFLLDQYCRDKTFIVLLMFGKLLFNLLPGKMTLRSSFGGYFFIMHCANFFWLYP
jgi:hypothetical protein